MKLALAASGMRADVSGDHAGAWRILESEEGEEG
jgi:hypothetical protein